MDRFEDADLYDVQLQYMQGLQSPDFSYGVMPCFGRSEYPFGVNIRYIEGARPIDISCDGMHYVRGAEKLSFNQFIALQLRNMDKRRLYFEFCYYASDCSFFRVRIEKIKADKVLFSSISISGCFDTIRTFIGREDHVWMDYEPFCSFKVGDCIGFNADVYRYIRKGNGNMLDYALENPCNIRRIKSYKKPGQKELIEQEIDRLICETCSMCGDGRCFVYGCRLPKEYRQRLRIFLGDVVPKHFTWDTIRAAYDIALPIIGEVEAINRLCNPRYPRVFI